MDESANRPDNESEEGLDWDPEATDEMLTMEKSTIGSHESNIDLTRRLIEEAAPHAALSMIQLARHAVNENTRMNASKWVVEMATQIQTEDGKAAWEKMLPDVVMEAEKITAGAVPPDQGDTAYEIGD